jgi:hypothetical protein
MSKHLSMKAPPWLQPALNEIQNTIEAAKTELQTSIDNLKTELQEKVNRIEVKLNSIERTGAIVRGRGSFHIFYIFS